MIGAVLLTASATGPTSTTVTIRGAVLKYIELVEQQLALSSGQDDPWATMNTTVQMLQPLLEKVFSVTATSAPVERFFSQEVLLCARTAPGSASSHCVI